LKHSFQVSPLSPQGEWTIEQRSRSSDISDTCDTSEHISSAISNTSRPLLEHCPPVLPQSCLHHHRSLLPPESQTMPELHPFGGRLSKRFGTVWNTVSTYLPLFSLPAQWQLVSSKGLHCWAVKCLWLVDGAGVLEFCENAKRVSVLMEFMNSCHLRITI
jgi:hypothetical protein